MKEIILKIGIWGLNIIYFFIKLFPQKNRVTYISRQSNNISFEFKMIGKELESRNKGIENVYLCRTLDGGVNSSLITKIKYGFHIFTQMYYIATSKVVVLDTYCIVISLLKHKKSLKVIQMWHSMGTMKKFGYQILDMAEGTNSKLAHVMKMHENYDYVFCAGEGYKTYLAEGFNCSEEIVKIFPLPRYDLLKSESYKKQTQEKIYNRYPELKNKKTIVYVPTFRKNEEHFIEALNTMIASYNKDYNLVLKIHPLTKAKITETDVFTCPEFSSFEMLFVADYVITDFSCILYEAAILDLPLYFYLFDKDEYLEKRGLNIDYDHDVPGVISTEFDVIMNAIESGKYDYESLFAFRDYYIHPTVNVTKQIGDFIISLM